MKIRALIAEDELPALTKLHNILLAIPEIEIIGEAQDGRSASELIRSSRPDVAFLDIRMPGVDGLSVVKSLEYPPKIVFVTAHSAHAVSAFEHQAYDYLLKPYTAKRVDSLIARLREQLKLERLAEWIRGEAQVAPAPSGDRELRLVLKLGSEIVFLNTREIECAITEGNYLHLMTARRKFFVRGVLSDLDRMLRGQMFVRVHRSAIVNLSRIRSISHDAREVLTINGFRLPISRARMQSVIEAVPDLGLPTLGARHD
jgi:DNA-binding LytR/AlgR family response regulator